MGEDRATVVDGATAASSTRGRTRGGGRGRRVVMVVVALVVLGVAAFASNAEPLVPSSGGYGVLGHDGAVIRVSSPASTEAYVAPYVEGNRVTVLLPIANDGQVPVRLLEVFPAERALPCGWKPDRVSVRDAGPGGWRLFEPMWLDAGQTVELAVMGTFHCDHAPARMDGLVSYTTVPVRYALGGLVPRTSDIDPGFTFLWTTDDVERSMELVEEVPPVDPAAFGGG